MLSDVIDLLQCPTPGSGPAGRCGEPFTVTERTVLCSSGHSFDIARQGQVNLLGHAAPANADTAGMVAARAEFLTAGHYQPIADLVAGAAQGEHIIDAGAGTGYYLSAVLARLGPTARGIAADVSAYACRRAAKVQRVGAVVADTWAGLPVRDGVADTILTIFAPRNFPDYARICRTGGHVLVVTPLADHLAEIRSAHGLIGIEEAKHERLLESAGNWFEHEGFQELRYELDLGPSDVAHLIQMGPNAFHGSSATTATRTQVAVRLDIFNKVRSLCHQTGANPAP